MESLTKAPNLNHFWAAAVIEELLRNGVEWFCVAPGSRSAPLAWAVGSNEKTRSVVHFDERAAAFHALGIAKASRKPTVFLCSSGTAVANALPAVVEASMARVPLIVLTADRPPELQDAGANQTIDQTKIFGDYVRWRHDMPTAGPFEGQLRALLTAVDQAAYRACSIPSGPVHLNCMFREPLAPVDEGAEATSTIQRELDAVVGWAEGEGPYTQHRAPVARVSTQAVKEVTELVQETERGLLVAGQLDTVAEAEAVARLAGALGWPLVPDVTSGLRFGCDAPTTLHHVQLLLAGDARAELESAETLVHVGGSVTSRGLLEFLMPRGGVAARTYIRVAAHPYRIDPGHACTHRIQADIPHFCELIAETVPSSPSEWAESLAAKSDAIEDLLAQGWDPGAAVSEVSVARVVTGSPAPEGVLFLGNSMPIRDADRYGSVGHFAGRVAANRGASGIDGNIATAAGYARASGVPVTAVLGDLAVMHDLNSLALLRHEGAKVIVIVINNDGGGIFSFLPIARYREHFESFFGTPHGLTFKDIAAGFGLRYAQPTTNGELVASYGTAVEADGSSIIEVRTNREENVRIHGEIDAHVQEALSRPT